MPAKALPKNPTSKQLALRLRVYLSGRRKHLTVPKELGEQLVEFLEQNDSRISELLRANSVEVIKRREINAHRKVLMEFVQKARNQFRFYAQNHRAKGTVDADKKAVVNDQLATEADQALTWECEPGAMGKP